MSEISTSQFISIEELDEFVKNASDLGVESHSARHTYMMSRSLPYQNAVTSNPFSQDYLSEVTKTWELVSGRPKYTVSLEQDSNMQVNEDQLRSIYPFGSQDLAFTAEYWLGVYFILKQLTSVQGRKIVEYGVGWGNLTTSLLQAGFDVTAVDIERKWLKLLEMRVARLQPSGTLTTMHGEFGELPDSQEQYDAVLFFECFHHSLHHDNVIAKLIRRLKTNGVLIFAAEAIYPGYPIPWGVRQDGHSLWAIRSFGWMELGFSEDYFILLLRRHNLSLDRNTCPQAGAFGVVYKGTKDLKGVALGRTLLTSSETGFYPGEYSSDIYTRFTNGNAVLEIPSTLGSDQFVTTANLELKNWLSKPITCSVSGSDGRVYWSGVVAPQSTVQIDIPTQVKTMSSHITIKSDTYVPRSLGINDDERVLGIAVGYLSIGTQAQAF
jgi:2-polyprenyl-3-methyl-5-hydroxy-6-metoxy-1,4-benzoquinol methylase